MISYLLLGISFLSSQFYKAYPYILLKSFLVVCHPFHVHVNLFSLMNPLYYHNNIRSINNFVVSPTIINLHSVYPINLILFLFCFDIHAFSHFCFLFFIKSFINFYCKMARMKVIAIYSCVAIADSYCKK